MEQIIVIFLTKKNNNNSAKLLISTSMISNLSLYIKESYNELLNKVTWPTFLSLQSSTIVVLIASLIIALIIFIMDAISKNVLDLIYPG